MKKSPAFRHVDHVCGYFGGEKDFNYSQCGFDHKGYILLGMQVHYIILWQRNVDVLFYILFKAELH